MSRYNLNNNIEEQLSVIRSKISRIEHKQNVKVISLLKELAPIQNKIGFILQSADNHEMSFPINFMSSVSNITTSTRFSQAFVFPGVSVKISVTSTDTNFTPVTFVMDNTSGTDIAYYYISPTIQYLVTSSGTYTFSNIPTYKGVTPTVTRTWQTPIKL